VLEVAFYAVLLPLCVLTHRYVEAPGQQWGRALAHRWPAGHGPGGGHSRRCATSAAMRIG
jgi:peptidoglycan/LPS O-acetylase OafA/YrhL